MVKRGNEVDIEYSKKEIIDKMNSFFGYSVVEKLKLICFDDNHDIVSLKEVEVKTETINKYQNQINTIKNDKIKKSLLKLSKVFKQR